MTENCFIPVENEQIAILMKLLGHTDYVCLSVSQGVGVGVGVMLVVILFRACTFHNKKCTST